MWEAFCEAFVFLGTPFLKKSRQHKILCVPGSVGFSRPSGDYLSKPSNWPLRKEDLLWPLNQSLNECHTFPTWAKASQKKAAVFGALFDRLLFLGLKSDHLEWWKGIIIKLNKPIYTLISNPSKQLV